MACYANIAPLGRSCSPQLGGLKNIYLVSGPAYTPREIRLMAATEDLPAIVFGLGYDEITSASYFGFSVEGCYTAADLLALISEDGLSGEDLDYKITKIDVARQGAFMASEMQGTRENGSGFYKNSATIPTVGLLPETIALVQKLARIGCVVIGESYDGRFHAFGFLDRAKIETSSLTTGANFGDNPGATIVLSAEEESPLAGDLAVLDDEDILIERNSAGLVSFFHQLAVSA